MNPMILVRQRPNDSKDEFLWNVADAHRIHTWFSRLQQITSINEDRSDEFFKLRLSKMEISKSTNY